jgi:hypothetical protein
MKLYFPYISDKPDKKFYVIINPDGKRLYFGAAGYEHYTEGHLNEERKMRYINRHQKKEDWNNPNTAGYWSLRFQWLYPTYKKAYEEIKKDLRLKGIL